MAKTSEHSTDQVAQPNANIEQTLELRKYVAPEIIIGKDARLVLCRYLQHFTARRPMIVTDGHLLDLPWFQEILEQISSCTEDHFIFSDISPNPRDYETMLGADLFIAQKCDVIIAIGGGSPMDCAKGIGIVASNGGNILDYEGVDQIKLPGPPLICIPSTAGTSADVSQFAIICDTLSQVKKAIISKKVVPDLALIDPVPLMTMDMYLTACTGMDALTHAIEAYVSNAQSALTDVHALEAIKLVSENLLDAVKPERTLDTMFNMLQASLQAGLAFSNASLGAVHALAHSLGGLLDLPHGQCNSILLEHVIALNYEAAPARYNRIAEALGASPDRDSLIEHVRELRGRAGIKPYIEIDDISDKLMDQLTVNAVSDPCIVTNPKQLSTQEVKEIYGRIFTTQKS